MSPWRLLSIPVALHFMWSNFERVHQPLRVTPTMEAGGPIMCGHWTRLLVYLDETGALKH